MVGDTGTYFPAVFNYAKFEEMRARGEVKFSYNAMIAALFISYTGMSLSCNNPIDCCRD